MNANTINIRSGAAAAVLRAHLRDSGTFACRNNGKLPEPGYLASKLPGSVTTTLPYLPEAWEIELWVNENVSDRTDAGLCGDVLAGTTILSVVTFSKPELAL